MLWREWKEMQRRNETIVEAFMQGQTMCALAAQHRVSRIRIGQIIKAAGVERHEGGASLRARLKRQNRKGKRPEQSFPILGTGTSVAAM